MATATTIKYSLLCANFLLSFVEANPSPFAFPEPATLNSTTNGPPINSVFLPSQSGIGPSFCPNGFNLTSSLSPDYGIVASSSYPVKEHCDGKTWMPLGATSNGVPTVHAIYYSPYSSPSAVQTSTINLITAFVNGASTSSWFAPLTKYYDDCNHKPAVYFMGFVMGEFVSYYCDKNGSGNSNRCTAIAQADETWVISNQISNGVIGLQNLDVYVFVVDPAIDEYSAGISGGQKLGVTYW